MTTFVDDSLKESGEITFDPPRENKNKKQSECAPSEDSDQSGLPPSLIRVFAVRSVGS